MNKLCFVICLNQTLRQTDCWECAAVRFKVPCKCVCGVVCILKSAKWGHGWSAGIFSQGDSHVERSACVGEKWFEYFEMNHLKRNESSSHGGFVAVAYVPLRSKNMTFQDGSPPLSAAVQSCPLYLCLWKMIDTVPIEIIFHPSVNVKMKMSPCHLKHASSVRN